MTRWKISAIILSLTGLFLWRIPSILAAIPGKDAGPVSPQIFLPPAASTITETVQTIDSELRYLPLEFGAPEPLGNLADRWYLMIDDGHIAYREVSRDYHAFNKYSQNPVLVADLPWEGRVVQLHGTVLPGFRMWYSSFNRAQNLKQILYAESNDGLSWKKPNLEGSGNNAMLGGQQGSDVSVIHTPQDFDKPFKSMVYQEGGFHGYWSTSGTDSNPYPENPLFKNGSDVAHFYWDPFLQRYGGTAKERVSVGGIPRRSIRFIYSDNFMDWSLHPEMLAPDSLDDQLNPGFYSHIYGLPVFPMGEQYVGLLWFFRARDTAGLYGLVDVQLVSSHDGVNWIREEGNRPPILHLGPLGSWDRGQIYTAIQPVHVGHELWLYYSGCNLEHGSNLTLTVCSIGLAKAVYHRLASLSGTGVVLTTNMEVVGSALHVNYDAHQGNLRVELLRDGTPIPGYEAENCVSMTGDSLDQVVSWSGQSDLPEVPFQIKFLLENSAIFAFLIE